MTEYTTNLGSLDDFRKGGIHAINDDPKNYVFSNIFEVAGQSAAFERVAVAKNLEYVVEVMLAEGTSPWFTAAHDEFALCMDGQIGIELVKNTSCLPENHGAILLKNDPSGPRMGRIRAKRGHMSLLPAGAAYRISSQHPSVVLFQTIEGPLTVHKWESICQTD